MANEGPIVLGVTAGVLIVGIFLGCAVYGNGYGQAQIDFTRSPKQFARYALNQHPNDVMDLSDVKQLGGIVDAPVQ